MKWIEVKSSWLNSEIRFDSEPIWRVEKEENFEDYSDNEYKDGDVEKLGSIRERFNSMEESEDHIQILSQPDSATSKTEPNEVNTHRNVSPQRKYKENIKWSVELETVEVYSFFI